MGIPIDRVTEWFRSEKPDTAQAEWDTWQAPHRATLALVPSLLNLTSLYEIGCGAGANLRLLREFRPDLRLEGTDVNREYVEFAFEHLDIPIYYATMPHVVGPSWDATLSCYALAYCTPAQAQQQLVAIHSKYLILIEPWSTEYNTVQMASAKEDDVPDRYHHGWPYLAKLTGWELEYRWPIEPVDYLSCLAVYKKAGM